MNEPATLFFKFKGHREFNVYHVLDWWHFDAYHGSFWYRRIEIPRVENFFRWIFGKKPLIHRQRLVSAEIVVRTEGHKLYFKFKSNKKKNEEVERFKRFLLTH